jgi:two-component system sensor histidine kinase UhpB
VYRDIGSWSFGPAGIRRILDASCLALTLALFTHLGDPDVLLDALWVTLAIGGFVFGLRRTLLRIVYVLTVMAVYWMASSAGLVLPIDFELLDLTEWPVMLVIALVVALMADRVSMTARRYAVLYREASDRLVTTQEEERERLARDLHDGVGQNLTAVILSLDAAGTANASRPVMQAAVRRARSLAVSALDEARDVATRLRPARIQEIGLGAAISDLANTAGVPIEVRFDVADLPPGLLDPEREINAFRIVQEAFSNAARHSRAAHVWVDAKVDGRLVRLVIGDDGVGFEPSISSGGLGLNGMDERARLLRARLEIQSRMGAGTRVELRIPIEVSTGTESMDVGGGVAMEPAR